MFYLEDEKNDFVIREPLEIDTPVDIILANEKKEEISEETPPEEATEEVAEPTEEATAGEEETPPEEATEEVVEATEEATAGEETPTDEVVEEEAEATEEATAGEEETPPEEATEEVAESSKETTTEEVSERPELTPKEKTYLDKQTNIYQATHSDMRKDLSKFRSGDTVSVGYRVIEGDRSRIQNFDGVVIKISAGHGMDKTFTVRKVSSGIGVERIFPFHSPNIDFIKIVKQGKVRRAKLYYLRSRVGKGTRIKERNSQ